MALLLATEITLRLAVGLGTQISVLRAAFDHLLAPTEMAQANHISGEEKQLSRAPTFRKRNSRYEVV